MRFQFIMNLRVGFSANRDACYLQAAAYYNLGRLPEAEGWLWRGTGSFDEATKRLEYLQLAPKAANSAEVRQVLARIAELVEKGAGREGNQFARGLPGRDSGCGTSSG